MTAHPHRLAPVDTPADGERLSADDMATAREGQFLASSLSLQRQAAQQRQAMPGTCANCAAQCLPLAVYCDAGCRTEHEDRLRTLRRQGRSG